MFCCVRLCYVVSVVLCWVLSPMFVTSRKRSCNVDTVVMSGTFSGNYTLWSYVMLCYVMLCCAVLCCVVLCYVLLCYAMPCYVILCCLVLRHFVLCYVVLCYVVSCRVDPRPGLDIVFGQFQHMLCFFMLSCIMLCCVCSNAGLGG